MKTKITVDQTGTTIELAGDLVGDLSSQLTPLVGVARGPRVRLMLAKLRNVSTPGIAQWVAFRTALPTPVEMHECPSTFIDFANLMSGVVGDALVVSFEIPLACSGCDETRGWMVETAAIRARGVPPLPPCAACGKASLPEVPLEDYLAFLGPLASP